MENGATGQFRTVRVVAKFTRNQSLAFVLRTRRRRAALRSPRRIDQIGQLPHVVARYTADEDHERIAKIHTPSFLDAP